jgi:hypothetical protein
MLFVAGSYVVGYYFDASCTECAEGALSGLYFLSAPAALLLVLGISRTMRDRSRERRLGLGLLLFAAVAISAFLVCQPAFLFYRWVGGT